MRTRYATAADARTRRISAPDRDDEGRDPSPVRAGAELSALRQADRDPSGADRPAQPGWTTCWRFRNRSCKSQGIEVIEEGDGGADDAQRRRRKNSHLLRQRGRQRDPGDARRRRAADRLSRRTMAHFMVRFSDTGAGIDPRGRRARVRAVLHHQARGHRARAVSLARRSWKNTAARSAIAPSEAAARHHRDLHLPARRGYKNISDEHSLRYWWSKTTTSNGRSPPTPCARKVSPSRRRRSASARWNCSRWRASTSCSPT